MEQIMATDAMSEFFKEGDRRTDGPASCFISARRRRRMPLKQAPLARERRRRHPGKRWKTDRQAAGRRRLLAFSAADDGSERDLARSEDECGSLSSILARVKYARNIFTSRLSCTHVRDGCDRHLECSLPPSPISICPFTRKSRPEMGRADTTSDAESVARREEREDNRILKLISDMRRSGRRESESVCIRKIRYALRTTSSDSSGRSVDSCGQKALLQM